jgi:hypothetical protein
MACNLLNPEKAGIYGCDQYCDQLIGKAETCANEAGLSLDEFAADADPEWKGKGKQEIIDSCNEKIKDKSEASCQAETGTFNNLSCDDILSTIGTLGGAS